MALIGRLSQRGVREWLLIGCVSQGTIACVQPIEIFQPEPVVVLQSEESAEVVQREKSAEALPSILRDGPTLNNAQLSSITILPMALPQPSLASEAAEVPEKAVAVVKPSADQGPSRQQAPPNVVTPQAEPEIVEKSGNQSDQVPDQPDAPVTTGKDNSEGRVEEGVTETARVPERVPERAPDIGLGDVRLGDIGLGDTELSDVRLGDIGLDGTGLGNVSLGDIGLGGLELGGDDDDDDGDDDD